MIPLGFTGAGQLLSADFEIKNSYKKTYSWRLITRDLHSGRVVSESDKMDYPLEGMLQELTPDGEWLALRAIDNWGAMPGPNNTWKFLIMSTRTGELRYSSIPIGRCDNFRVSPDSSCLLVTRYWSPQNVQNWNSLIDLETGQECRQFAFDSKSGGEDAVFSPDSREVATLRHDISNAKSIVFYSVLGDSPIARCPLSALPENAGLRLGGWHANRLTFEYSFKSPEAPTRVASCELTNHQLSDFRNEPGFGYTMDEELAETRFAMTGEGWKAYVWQVQGWGTPRWLEWWNRWPGQWLPQIEWVTDYHSQVQLVDPRTDAPIGRELELEGHDGSNYAFAISDDGRWVVDGGESLRVWKTPPAPRLHQLPWLLLAASLPWIALRVLFKSNPTTKRGSVSAGSTTSPTV